MASPKAEGTVFNIHLTGNITGKTWDGDFRAKPILTFRDRLGVDRMRRELLGGDGTTADTEAAAAAKVISELAYRLTEWPEWWKESKGGLDLADVNVMQEVYKAAEKVENDYFTKLEADGKAAQEKLKELTVKPV